MDKEVNCKICTSTKDVNENGICKICTKTNRELVKGRKRWIRTVLWYLVCLQQGRVRV